MTLAPSMLKGVISTSVVFNKHKVLFIPQDFSCSSFWPQVTCCDRNSGANTAKLTFLHSNNPFEHTSVRLLSVNKAFSNSAPKSIIKSGCRQGRRGKLKWGRETNGAPRCRLGCRRWGCKRDLMVGWIREILVTMLNNYGSSRDQSAIDWTPQAFSTQSLGKQRLVN